MRFVLFSLYYRVGEQVNINSAAIIALLIVILYFVSNVGKRFKKIGSDSLTYLNTQAKLKSIEYAPSGIITIDSTGRVVAWNQGALNIFGYSEQEMMGKTLRNIMPERNWLKHLAALDNPTGRPSMIGRTMDLTACNREKKEIDVRLTLWKWNEGINIFYTGIVRDITVEKAAEKKLSQLLEMYSLAEEIDDSGVWSWDVLTDTVYTSKGMDRIYGIDTTDEKESGFLLKRVYHEDLPMLEARIRENFEKKLPYESEYRIVQKDGQIVKVRVEGIPKVNSKGELISITGTMHKIS